MVIIKESHERKRNDYYPTPPAFCDSALKYILNYISPFYPKRILDPGMGSGPWGSAIRNFYPPSVLLTGIDIDLAMNEDYTSIIHGDFIKHDFGDRRFELIVGNPPYSLIREFIDKSFELLSDGGYIAFLLRLAYLESAGRYHLYKQYPPRLVLVSSQRIPFRPELGSGTDDTAYAMFLWQKGYKGKTELDWFLWRKEG